MGISLDDIAAQRAMLKRGEENRKADWKQAERERLRDTFAAAALTGLLAGPAAGPTQTFDDFASEAYRLADAMLRERGNHPEIPDSSTNHDAAPAARVTEKPASTAACQSVGTDKAEPLTGNGGTGNTPVTEPLPVFVSGSGSVTPVSYAKTNAERVDYATNRDTTTPRNGSAEDKFDRPKPVKDDDSDRSKPISDERLAALEQLSALDQELEARHGLQGNPMIKAQRSNESI